jgi:beta-lactamase regulating signal transducer with metallopeptidase domain/Ca2+-binding EF-hand superfamily protein
MQNVLSNAAAAAVLAVVALAVGRLCRRPGIVHALWLIVLLKLVTPPIVGIALPLAIAPAAAPDVPAAVAMPDAMAGSPAAPAAAGAAPTSGAATAKATGPHLPWWAMAAGVWATGTAAWTVVLVVRMRRLKGILRLARPAGGEVQRLADGLARRLGLAGSPPVLVLPARVPPLLWFAGRSARVYLPEALLGRMDRPALATVLAHELAHLKRRDHWVRLLEMAVLGLYWWHPAVWLALRQLHRAEEACCDAMVVGAMPGRRREYAGALLTVAEFLSDTAPPRLAAASGIGNVNSIRRRLKMIVNASGTGSSRVGAAGLWLLAALVLPVGPVVLASPGGVPAVKPDILKDAVDPYDAAAEKARFFAAAGADNEMDANEFKAAAGKDKSFLRGFDSWSEMLKFDKDRNGTLDWFEADAYRQDLRKRVLAEFDADKDGKLAGAEREKAAEGLVAGKVPGATIAPRPVMSVAPAGLGGAGPVGGPWVSGGTGATRDANGGWTMKLPGGGMARFQGWQPSGEQIKKYDKDGDGKLSSEEMKAMWADQAEQWRIKRYDKDGDGKLNDEERAAMEKDEAARREAGEKARQEYVKKYDKDGDGKLNEEETAVARAEQQRLAQEYYGNWKKWREKQSKEADADGDGKTTPEEWRVYNEKRQAEMLKKYDADGDGKLNEEERSKMRSDTGEPSIPGMVGMGGTSGAMIGLGGAGAMIVGGDPSGATVIPGPGGATRIIIGGAGPGPAPQDK